jgi:hypothetical protein
LPRRCTRCSFVPWLARHTPRAHGQSLVVLALVLPVLVALTMTAIEVATRLMEVAELEDALRQATRSSVQLLDYAALADNSQRVSEARVIEVARATLRVNLGSARGLNEPVEALVSRVEWQVLPSGGVCTLRGEGTLVAGRAERTNGQWRITFPTPAVCATVRPKLRGLLGWGEYAPQINAAETLDVLVSP